MTTTYMHPVIITYNAEWEEFTVGNGRIAADYYTTDAEDAYNQALFVAKHEGRELKIKPSAKSRIAKVIKKLSKEEV